MLDPVVETMRLWHLFAHTSGLTYGFMFAHPVDELYRQAGFEWGMPRELDLEGVVDRWAALPLLFQPGTEWNYSVGLDVLGRVLEVITGQRLDELMRTRLLEPLGMNETTWFVDEANAPRLAALYGAHPATRKAMRIDAMDRGALDANPRPTAAAAAWSARPTTTTASPRCCCAVASSTGCASSPRAP